MRKSCYSAAGESGIAGDVTLTAAGNIFSGDIQAFSKDNDLEGASVSLNSLQGSVILDGVTLSTTNTGTSFAGIININGKDIQINSSNINNTGFDGLVFIGVEGKVNEDGSISKSPTTASNVTIKNSTIDTTRNQANPDLQITTGEGIQISSNGKIEIDKSILTAETNSSAPSGSIILDAKGSVSLSNGAELRVNTRGTGDAGEINIKAEQLSLRSNSGLIGDVDPNGNGKGASVNLNVTGEILLDGSGRPTSGESTRITTGILADESGQQGRGTGGETKIKAGSLVLKNGAIIKSSTQGQGDAGPISVDADVVDISGSVAGSGLPSGFFTSTTTNGKAGDITVKTGIFKIADGAALSARTTGNGQGGTIKVNASSFEATNGGQLVTTTSGSGQAGSIIVNATDQVTISGSDPNYSSRIAKFRNLNDPRVANKIEEGAASGLFANTTKNSTGKGGDISISIPMGSFSVTNGAQLRAFTNGQGNAGNVIINAGDNVTFDNAYAFATVQESGRGKGGDIRISIPTGSLIVRNGAQLQALTEGTGNAGNVTINARDITFDGTNTSGQPSAAFVTVNERAEGNAGNIEITTGSLSITNGARLFANTLGQGNAGIIKINATGSVNISGSNSINGQPSGLFTSTSSDSKGAGGNITVGDDITKPNLFRISDGAVLFASTSNDKQAGNITVNANRFEAINGGQLITTTTSSNGPAGTITVNAGRRVTISGRDATFAERRSKLGGANDENIFTNPDTNKIVTGTDVYNTNSEVFSGFYVNSQKSTSRAGDIVVNSPIVFLDNKGRLIADSASSNGGNITLQNGNLLLLRRNSLISTTGGTERREGSGGNIKVDYPKGFIIAGFARNNDIAANAFIDFGGKVDIIARGAVNIEALSRKDLERRLQGTRPLDPQRLPTNDITAISQENPNLSGTVNSNAPNVDPTRGTIQLPEDLGDSSRLIAQSCPVGVQGAASRFVVTGRGGLPPNPGSALSTDTFLGSAANAPSGENATASTSIPPQEAQGVEIGPRGEIILTARPSTLTPHTPWQRLTDCYGK